jgi:hypothetical protein
MKISAGSSASLAAAAKKESVESPLSTSQVVRVAATSGI